MLALNTLAGAFVDERAPLEVHAAVQAALQLERDATAWTAASHAQTRRIFGSRAPQSAISSFGVVMSIS